MTEETRKRLPLVPRNGTSDTKYVLDNLSLCVSLLDSLELTRKTIREKVKAFRVNRKILGLCVRCGKPVDRLGKICALCLKLERDHVIKRKQKVT